ncbi:MAG: hypothetical protein HY731_05140 [Candidatus Tectomicrobia bacterium]|nr:hypothetical protein [Candidatus Tectomicrobia bacterium]
MDKEGKSTYEIERLAEDIYKVIVRSIEEQHDRELLLQKLVTAVNSNLVVVDRAQSR